jgi:hypothetical protein
LAGADQPATTPETVIRLTVRPKAPPKPALRYRLLPELREMQPGNPIPNYSKCLIARDYARQTSLGQAALRQADRAARLDKPDWGILDQLKRDGYSLLLPDVQGMRELALGLQERFRRENASGRIDDALETAKTMFAMARHLGEHPTLIGDLVGISVANVAIVPLEELLEHPDCPNFYWALTDLPEPLVPLCAGMAGQGVADASELRALDDRGPMTGKEIDKFLAHVEWLATGDMPRRPEDSAKRWVAARAKDPKLVGAARKRLADYGIPEDRSAGFPPEQVVLLDSKREYELRRDELAKLMPLPYWQIDALTRAETPAAERALFDVFLPAILRVRQAQARLDQRVALLRHVEALRMYAAEHEARLPDKLSDIAVPLPVDPFSGKPFLYERKGNTAVLRGRPPRGGEKNPANNVRYEVTLAR